MRARARRRQRGFTLLEVLVALAIVAMSLGLLYRSSGTSARNAGDIDQMQRAVVLAESLRDLRDSVSADGWQDAGTSAGYAWQVRSAPYATGVQGANVPRLHEIHIAVSWSDGSRPRQVDVFTLLPEHRPVPPALRR